MEGPGRLTWLDAARGLAMLWILTYHLRSDTAGITAMGPAVVGAARSLDGLGRMLADGGYQGVALFLFASGTGLAISAASRGTSRASAFYRDRARRLLPAYYMAVVVTGLALAGLARWSVPLLDHSPYRPGWAAWTASVTVVGRLGSASLSQAPPPSAWFIVLLLQLYLLFPLIWWTRRRIGPAAMLAIALALTVGCRYGVHTALGWAHQPGQEAYWLSVLAPARLAEFAGGVALGPALARLRPWTVAALAPVGAASWAAGASLEGGRWDAFSTTLIIAGLVPLVAAASTLLSRLPGAGSALRWVGRRSLEIFLVQDAVRLGLGAWENAGHQVAWGLVPAGLCLGAVLLVGAGFGAALDVLYRTAPLRGPARPRYGSPPVRPAQTETVPAATSRP